MAAKSLTELIKSILISIENDDIDVLPAQLRLLPLKQMSTANSDTVLALFLNNAASLNRIEVAGIIVEHWIRIRQEFLTISILTLIHMNIQVNDNTLAFLRQVYPGQHIGNYILDLINYDSSPEVFSAAHRLIRIFGEQDYTFWKFYYDIIQTQLDEEEIGNQVMVKFLIQKLQETTPFIPAPDYVKDFGLRSAKPAVDIEASDVLTPTVESLERRLAGEPSIAPGSLEGSLERAFISNLFGPAISGFEPQEIITVEPGSSPLPFDEDITQPILPDPTFHMPSTEKAVEMLTAGFQGEGIYIDPEDNEEWEHARQIIGQEYSIATNTERLAMLRPIFVTNQRLDYFATDELLFRLLGPVNATYNIDMTMDHPCAKYGGCRMLTCLEYENYDQDFGVIDEELDLNYNFSNVNWFTGACDFCHQQILKRCYAVRKPLSNGGWVGCYCSWDHVRKDLSEPEYDVILMTRRLEGRIKEIGIQDRQYRFDPRGQREVLPSAEEEELDEELEELEELPELPEEPELEPE
jgi:hypothetical protein